MGQQTSRQLGLTGMDVAGLARTSISTLTLSKRERHSAWLDNKIARLLKTLAQTRSGRVKTLNQILLKFGQLNEGFQCSRTIFNKIDKQSRGQLSMQDVQKAAMEANLGLDNDTIVKLFDSADLEGTHQLEFREFVLVIAAVYIFREAEGLPHRVDPAIIKTMEIALEAFLYFDKFGEGYIRKEDVMTAVSETGSPTAKHASTQKNVMSSTISQRFGELDWDHSGKASFREFLYGLEGWVLEEYEDDPVDRF